MIKSSNKRPTVNDVAKLAGVGASTVSRYLRGVQVTPDAARRIADAVKQLEYSPHEAARILRGGATRTIGVVVPQVDNTFFSRAIQAIESEAHRRGFAILLLLHEEDATRQFNHLSTLRRYSVDGILLAPASNSRSEEIMSIAGDTPVVIFDRFFSDQFDSVTLRNRDAARIATDHLLRHGHTSVACITAKSELYTFKERIAGYCDALTAAGLQPSILDAADYKELRLTLASTMSSRSHPQALLSLSNMATGSLLFAFNDLGLSDHERIPFIGFDDFDFAPLVHPALTVMRQPIELMVRYALELLFQRVAARSGRISAGSVLGIPSEIQKITLAAELVCRHSCGCD